MKKLVALMVALLLSTAPASAGNIAEVFSGEIFGVAWCSNQQQVSKVFPNGKSTKVHGTQFYTVKDGRTLLGIKRNPENIIKFVFNAAGKMNKVTIEFPNGLDGFGILRYKLNEYFGEDTYCPERDSYVIEWCEDSGIRISLLGTLFSIEYIQAKSSVTKEKLGF